VLLRLREIFDDVRFYKANRAAYDKAATRDLALPRVHLEALIDVVDGKLPLVVNVNRASDITALLAFAQEQKIRVVVDGGAEAWVLAKELAQAKVPVILTPSAAEPSSFDALRARDDAASILQQAGVVVAIASGNDGTTRARQEAGVAVAYGMTHEAALQAITQAPARIFGLDNDVGTVAVGKRANLVVWSGDPFETKTAADVVVIGGEKMSTDTRQLMLARKYHVKK
jgi:imidazolonepropionase-like amidohydrolase